MSAVRASGVEPGQRRLNGPQTTGRDYQNLSTARYTSLTEINITIPMRDGTLLLADVRRPCNAGRVPALVAAAPYPRQMQDLNAPIGVVESGACDFWAPRGYAHVFVNLRGTGGSQGKFTFIDEQERKDLYDVIEWVAVQDWCDGNVGVLGISYFAISQMEAAVMKPPHLKAIFPFNVSIEAWEASHHNGLLSAGFINPWLSTLGVLSAQSDWLYRGPLAWLVRKICGMDFIHRRFATMGGENSNRGLRALCKLNRSDEPWNDLWLSIAVKHQVRDEFWAARDLRPLLKDIEVPTYLGSEWSNVPLHLPGTFAAWDRLRHKENVRLAILGDHGMTWPWESMHTEALAWFDHWLKGKQTGIMDGPRIRYFLPVAEEWRALEEWPPKGYQEAYALNVDGTLSTKEVAGSRDYLWLVPGTDSGLSAGSNIPSSLTWLTSPIEEDMDLVGNLKLQLDASITAFDTTWIVALKDVAPDGSTAPVTHGWLRASLRQVEIDSSNSSDEPELPQDHPMAVPPNQVVNYYIPMIPNARRFKKGHRISLTISSDDTVETGQSSMGFTHQSVGTNTWNTIYSSSRLFLPFVSNDE